MGKKKKREDLVKKTDDAKDMSVETISKKETVQDVKIQAILEARAKES